MIDLGHYVVDHQNEYFFGGLDLQTPSNVTLLFVNDFDLVAASIDHLACWTQNDTALDGAVLPMMINTFDSVYLREVLNDSGAPTISCLSQTFPDSGTQRLW